MKIKIRGFITHKVAENYSDCADRYAVNTDNNRFAIADGVSKSFFPDIWADILVNDFVLSNHIENKYFIDSCQFKWRAEVEKKVQSPDVKWYTKNAFIKNASGLATFVTLRFEKDKWFATALGDSFLFFIPNKNIGFDDWVKISSKPEPVVFDSFPDYYSSRNQEYGKEKKAESDLSEGTFYLMTDALSEWVFSKKEEAIDEINNKWNSQNDFEHSVNELRNLNYLNNDDSAILIINLANDGKQELTYESVDVQNFNELVVKEKEMLEKQKKVEEKEESFITEAKSLIENNEQKNLPSTEEAQSNKRDEKKEKKYKKALNDCKTRLKPFSEEDREKIINELCKEYGISIKD